MIIGYMNIFAFVVMASSQLWHIFYECNQLYRVLKFVKGREVLGGGKKKIAWNIISNILLIVRGFILIIIYLVICFG